MIEYIDLKIDFTNRNARVGGVTLDRVTTRNYDTAIRFRIEIIGHTLDDAYDVKILSKYNNSGLNVMTTLGDSLEIADRKIIYTPKVNLITEADYIRNFLYLSKDGLGLDMAQFNYQVDVSQIGEVTLDIRQAYDESYETLITEFEQALEDYKLTLPQADSVRAEIDVVLNQFGVDSQKAIGDLGEVSATIEIAEASRVEKENERVQAETERKEAEILREDNYEQLIDTAIVEADVVEKVDNKVTELTPKITELTAQLEKTNGRMDGIAINVAHPPIPFRKITSDANYYDSANFKYYKDEQMTIPATDNTGVVQALVNFLHEKGGGTLLVPDGKYVFRSTVAWKSRVSLIGASKTGTRLYSEGVQFSLIRGTDGNSDGSSGNDPSVWFDDCKFTDFLIDNKGLSFSEKTVDGKALFILYMRRAVFRDLILLNTLGTALGCDFLVDTVIDTVFTDRAGRSSYPTGHGGNSGIGIGTSALSDEPLVVTNCFTYNSGNYGVFVETQNNPSGVKAKYAKIVNCHSQGNRLGFGNKGSGGTQFIGCTAVDNRLHGFHLTQGVSGDQLLGCISEKNGGDGVRIEKDYVGDLDISNVWANENIGAGIRALNNGAILKNIRILDSKTHRNGSSGVWIGGNTKNIDIKGVNSVNNGQDSSVAVGFRRGILVEGVNDIVSILDNTVFDDQQIKTQVGGIKISNTTTNYILDGNNVTGYAPNAAYIVDLTKGKIGTNSDLSFEKHGLATIAEGQQSVDVVHGMGKIPTAINISAVQYTGIPVPIWIVKSDGNMIRVRKELMAGAVDFYWDVKTD